MEPAREGRKHDARPSLRRVLPHALPPVRPRQPIVQARYAFVLHTANPLTEDRGA